MVNKLDFIKIKLASPARIIQWATRELPNGQCVGEVESTATVNYKTFEPIMGGLFCARIFGPIKSFNCICGKYEEVYRENLICDKCGVELTEVRVRRHRMGYVNLIYPVIHVWYLNSRPNLLALLLEVESYEKMFNTNYNQRSKKCFECLPFQDPHNSEHFFERNITYKFNTSALTELWDERIKRIKLVCLAYFISPDETSFYGLQWDFQEYRFARKVGRTCYNLKPYPKPKNLKNPTLDLIRATPNHLIGTPLISRELIKLNLKAELFQTRSFMFSCSQVLNKHSLLYKKSYWFRKWEKQRISKLRSQSIKRIRLLENLIATHARPEWTVFTKLPIIPPALRPMIQLEAGKFATSDLNELYRRVLTRNGRLLSLLKMGAPQLVIRNEKRMVQEAIDMLFENGRRGNISLSSTNNRPLKSLSDIIKGKYGRFRQNLLGKRVDYSGRSVIVVGPNLKLNQCGLPYEMAIELFQPFVMRELINQDLALNIRIASMLIRKNDPVIDLVLKKVLSSHPVFLNRAPTLHRLGVQAFEPVLISGKAIQLHPLVCSAFNADFDGDQMAVHIPLSLQAQSECYMLLFAPYNFLSPANGDPIIVPSQDMVLGCYYLTSSNISNLLGSNNYFADFDDVLLAYNQDNLELHSLIWVRYNQNFDINSSLIAKKILKDETSIEYYKNLQIRKNKAGSPIVSYIQTTPGKIIFNYTLTKALKFLSF